MRPRCESLAFPLAVLRRRLRALPLLTTESVCETEIKVRQHGGYTVLAVVLVILGIAIVGVNKARAPCRCL